MGEQLRNPDGLIPPDYRGIEQRYDLGDAQFGALLDHIADVGVLPDRSRLIAISGIAGSGKTRLGVSLSRALGAAYIPYDHYFRDVDGSQLRLTDSWDNYDAESFRQEIVMPLRRGETSVHYQTYDWIARAYGEWRVVPATDFVIVEGVGLFRDDLRDLFDDRVWMEYAPEAASRAGYLRDEARGVSLADWQIWEKNDQDFVRRFRPQEHATFSFRRA